jgi:hypothetical protein
MADGERSVILNRVKSCRWLKDGRLLPLMGRSAFHIILRQEAEFVQAIKQLRQRDAKGRHRQTFVRDRPLDTG